MAPKKKEQQKMTLGAFLTEEKYGGSWADEVEDSFGSQPFPSSSDRRPAGSGGYSSYSGFTDRGYSVRESVPTRIPDRPPFTAHLGNLSYDATNETVTEFFEGCDVTSVRIIEDRIEQRPKGFAYAEFANVEGLKKALELDGENFQGRTIKIKVADPPKDRPDRSDTARDLLSWERKGPLADIPGRSNDRRPSEFGGERRASNRDPAADDGRVRDFGNWERKGPLSPLPQAEGSGSRESSRPPNDGSRGEGFNRKDRRVSPAAWGEGRQEGSRPPREQRGERPPRPERAPTAAEQDNEWRSKMRPDASESQEGSEAPGSPSVQSASIAARPRLNLQKRSVAEPDLMSPPPGSAGGDSKASPFGAARPIDTAAKEREIAEKRDQVLKEKKEAEDKAKEERRLAKEAAEKEAAEPAPAEEPTNGAAEAAEPSAEAAQDGEASNEATSEQRIPTRPKEQVQNPKSRAAETGSWRSQREASGEQRSARGGYQNARGRGEGRGRGGSRGGARQPYEGRPPRTNGSAPTTPQLQQGSEESEAAADSAPKSQDEIDGWTTVSKPRRGRA